MNTKNKPSTLPLALLRVGLSLVFLWFGTQQLLHTEAWIKLIPQWVVDLSSLSATTLTHINGSFEIVFGMALLLGICTRLSAFLLALHLIEITYTVGYGPVGVRDFGLTIATLAVFLYGADRYTFDRLFYRNSGKRPLLPPNSQAAVRTYMPYVPPKID